MDYSVVTCITGNFNKLHYTDIEKAYVYTTLKDDEFIDHASSQGWDYKRLPFFHSYNLREATRQSKYVKFLKYFEHETKYVIYVDHKYILKKEHIKPLIEQLGDDAFLSFKNPSNIYKELYNSLSYSRYTNDLSEMVRSIKDHESDIDNLELFYGGLIVYNTHHPEFQSIKSKMEEYVEKYKHVQDQLLFPLALRDIKKVLIHNTIGIEHRSPQKNIQGETY